MAATSAPAVSRVAAKRSVTPSRGTQRCSPPPVPMLQATMLLSSLYLLSLLDHPTAKAMLWTTFTALLVAFCLALATPAPRPVSYLKQTNRDEIVARRNRSPVRRVASSVAYPDCSFTSSTRNAAIYAGRQASFPAPMNIVGSSPANTLQKCVEACGANQCMSPNLTTRNASRLTNGTVCNSGTFRQLPTYTSCLLLSYSYVNGADTPDATAFFLDKTCASQAASGGRYHATRIASVWFQSLTGSQCRPITRAATTEGWTRGIPRLDITYCVVWVHACWTYLYRVRVGADRHDKSLDRRCLLP